MQGNVNIPDSTITSALTFRQLVLMNMQQLTNFPYIEKDFDALTDYELLCLVVKFLNDVIANQNEQNDSITNMYNAFLALQTYVNNTKDTLEDAFNNLDDYVRNYFDNLDVQDEINNKLEQMLQDGELDSIIEQFLQSNATWSYDTVADMKLATNLINGSVCKTLGFYSINDGGSSTYLIRTKTVDDTPNEYDLISLYNQNLVAEYIEDKVVNIKQLGYINTMSTSDQTSFLNYVFETYKNILIKDETLTINDNLDLESNQTIKMENAKIHNTSTENQKYIFNIVEKSNIDISGINSELYFDKPSTAQQACLRISNGTNIYFKGINLKSAGGDGIIVSGTDNKTISSNINVENCLIDNNRRNGVSLIGGLSGFYIKNCTISNTSGTNPQYAIDLEPWQDGIYNNDVIIDNCIIKDNVGGIDLMPFNKNIKIINNYFYDTLNSVITEAKGQNAYPKQVIIKNNKFDTAGIYLRGTQYAEYIIESNTFLNSAIVTDSESDFTVHYTVAPHSGYVKIINNFIKDSGNHSISIGGSDNVLIDGNTIETPINRFLTTTSVNNIILSNNNFMNHAQNTTTPSNIYGMYFLTTHNIMLNGNTFVDTSENTYGTLLKFNANCQKLMVVNNNFLNVNYTNLISKDGTITNEIIDNNLVNT